MAQLQYDSSTPEAGGLDVQDHPQLYSKFEVSLVRKKKKKKNWGGCRWISVS